MSYAKEKVSGDVYFSEDLSRSYNTETISINNATNEDLKLSAGYPMINGTPALISNVEITTGFLIEDVCVEANTTIKTSVFINGIGIAVNKDLLPEKDINEDVFLSTLQDRMKELNFIVKETSELSFI